MAVVTVEDSTVRRGAGRYGVGRLQAVGAAGSGHCDLITEVPYYAGRATRGELQVS